MRIEIAPDFYCDDWEELETKLDPDGEWSKSPVAWERAIDVIQGRIQARFLGCADELQDIQYAGFAILALDCLLIETVQAFRSGTHAKTNESREAFRTFLTSSPQFRNFFLGNTVDDFYRNVRNGLLHDGETRSGWLVRAGRKYELVQRQPNGFVIVNREKFHQALVQEIRAYLMNLSNPLERELRKNLIRALNDLCARSRPKL